MNDEPKMEKLPINNNNIDTEQQSKFIHQQCILAIYQSHYYSQVHPSFCYDHHRKIIIN